MSTWLATTTWPFLSCWVDSTINVGANIHVVQWANGNWLPSTHFQLGSIDCDAAEGCSGCRLYIPSFACGHPAVTLPILFTPHFVLKAFFNPRASQFVCFDGALSENRLPIKNKCEKGSRGLLDIQTKSRYFSVGPDVETQDSYCLTVQLSCPIVSLKLKSTIISFWWPFQSLDLNLSRIINEAWMLWIQQANALMCTWVFVECPKTYPWGISWMLHNFSYFISPSHLHRVQLGPCHPRGDVHPSECFTL